MPRISAGVPAAAERAEDKAGWNDDERDQEHRQAGDGVDSCRPRQRRRGHGKLLATRSSGSESGAVTVDGCRALPRTWRRIRAVADGASGVRPGSGRCARSADSADRAGPSSVVSAADCARSLSAASAAGCSAAEELLCPLPLLELLSSLVRHLLRAENDAGPATGVRLGGHRCRRESPNRSSGPRRASPPHEQVDERHSERSADQSDHQRDQQRADLRLAGGAGLRVTRHHDRFDAILRGYALVDLQDVELRSGPAEQPVADR